MLTTSEAGEVLGVSASRVRQLVLAGVIPAKRQGRDLWIHAGALTRAKNRQKRGGPKTKKRKSS